MKELLPTIKFAFNEWIRRARTGESKSKIDKVHPTDHLNARIVLHRLHMDYKHSLYNDVIVG